jgi:hypothetical protein
LKIGEAQQNYAEQLGKTVDQLTAEEQQQALLNETLRAGENLIRQAGESTESAVDSYDRLTTTVKNLGAELQKLANVGLTPAMDATSDMLGLYEEMISVINTYNDAEKRGLITKEERNKYIRQAIMWNYEYLDGVQDSIVKQDNLTQVLAKGSSEMVFYEGAVQHVISANGEYTYTIGEAAVATEQMAEALIYAVPNMSAMENAIYSSAAHADTLRNNIDEMVNGLYRGGSAATDFANKFNNASYNLAVNREELEELGATAEAFAAAGILDIGDLVDVNKLLGIEAALREMDAGFNTSWETQKTLRDDFGLTWQEARDYIQGAVDPLQQLNDLFGEMDIMTFDVTSASALQLASDLQVSLNVARALQLVLGGISGITLPTGLGANVMPTGYTDYMPGFASGGSFTVGGSGGTDSQMVSFMATPGEMVNVSTPGQGTGNTIVVNINSTFAPENEDQFMRMVRPAMAKLIREQRAL